MFENSFRVIQSNCCRIWLPKFYSNITLRNWMYENLNKLLLEKLTNVSAKRSQLITQDYKKCSLPMLWLLSERIAFAWINLYKFCIQGRGFMPKTLELMVLKMVLRSRHDVIKINGVGVLLNNRIKLVDFLFY